MLSILNGNICLKLRNYSKIFKILAFLITALFFIHPGRFNGKYDYIPNEEIIEYLFPARESDVGSCPVFPNVSLTVRDVPGDPYYDDKKWAEILKVNLGGWWSPDGCEPVHSIALVIPYRNRPKQLTTFLHYIHHFLQKQLVSYRIFIVEQAPGKPFNRGKLMNIGFKEALKLQPFPCFIFHDVDLIPQVSNNIYACTKIPRHMSASINVWRYNLLYNGAFGGVIAVLSEQFQKANGFSNLYFGWGAEDDDLLLRIRKNGLDIVRFSPEISMYYMLPHKKEVKNPERFSILKKAENRYEEDGLNSLDYELLSHRSLPLSTHVVVQV